MNEQKTRIISVCTEKGGVGKTTISNNLGCALGKAGYKVLMIDLDKQGNLSCSCGFLSEEKKRTISDIIYGAAAGFELNYEEYVYTSGNNPNVSYIPSGHMLNSSNSVISSSDNCNYVIRDILRSSFFERFDFIFLDNKTDLDLLAQNALNASDYVIIPIDAGIFSFDAIDNMLEKMKMIKSTTNKDLEIMGIIENKVDTTSTCKEIDEACKQLYKELVFQTRIPARPEQINKTVKCSAGCVNIKHNTLAECFENLAKEVLKRSGS